MSDTAVLIVGAGPVGLSSAFFLARHGIAPVVVEKRSTTSPYPRAATSMRTLEIFDSHGLGSELERAGWVNWGPMRAMYREVALDGPGELIDLPDRYTARLSACSPLPSRMVSQDVLEQLLLARLREYGVPVRFDCKVEDFETCDDGVAVHVKNSEGATERITADYVVAADGARSDVRRMLDVPLLDEEDAGQVITAFYRADLGDVVRDWESHLCVVRNDTVYATFYTFDGSGLWSSHIMDCQEMGEGTQLSHERTVELLHAGLGADVELDLVSVNPWRAALGVAASLRSGRVFLAGDAAHVQTSAGGLGMNTGIQDAHNLAWKLAEVVQGRASDALLDSYEPERTAAARDSVNLSRTVIHGYLDQEESIDSVYERCAADYLRGMMFYHYESGAVVSTEDGQPPGVLDDVAWPGNRFPHLWLADSGRSRSTIDLSGPNWLLLAGVDGQEWCVAADRCATRHGLDLCGRRVGPVCGDEVLGDPDGRFGAVADIGPAGAVLIRPDGVLAWRHREAADDPVHVLNSVLCTVLGTTVDITETTS